jgi:hypothetical protein
MNLMKERPMRWVGGILVMLGMASPALAAAHYRILLMIRMFLSLLTSCPSICPIRMSGYQAPLLIAFCVLGACSPPRRPPIMFSRSCAAAVSRRREWGRSGPATFTRWSGFYFGGDLSFNNATADFGTATAPLVQFAPQNKVVQQQFVLPFSVTTTDQVRD